MQGKDEMLISKKRFNLPGIQAGGYRAFARYPPLNRLSPRESFRYSAGTLATAGTRAVRAT